MSFCIRPLLHFRLLRYNVMIQMQTWRNGGEAT